MVDTMSDPTPLPPDIRRRPCRPTRRYRPDRACRHRRSTIRRARTVPLPGEPGPPPAGDPPGAPPMRLREVGGPAGPEPTRYGDWERKGRVSDF